MRCMFLFSYAFIGINLPMRFLQDTFNWVMSCMRSDTLSSSQLDLTGVRTTVLTWLWQSSSALVQKSRACAGAKRPTGTSTQTNSVWILSIPTANEFTHKQIWVGDDDFESKIKVFPFSSCMYVCCSSDFVAAILAIYRWQKLNSKRVTVAPRVQPGVFVNNSQTQVNSAMG